MDQKPVNETDFWRERIAEADAVGIEHHSVYQTGEPDWAHIEKIHSQIIAKHVMSEDRVLDAGCGYGRIAPLFSPSQYVGVDFSPEFIARAKAAQPEYRFIVASLDGLPFSEGIFEWSICISIKNMIVGNISEDFWLAMLAELKRVSKRVLVLEYSSPEQYEIL